MSSDGDKHYTLIMFRNKKQNQNLIKNQFTMKKNNLTHKAKTEQTAASNLTVDAFQKDPRRQYLS